METTPATPKVERPLSIGDLVLFAITPDGPVQLGPVRADGNRPRSIHLDVLDVLRQVLAAIGPFEIRGADGSVLVTCDAAALERVDLRAVQRDQMFGLLMGDPRAVWHVDERERLRPTAPPAPAATAPPKPPYSHRVPVR
ncbi:MAG TPA: hypothetical protein VLT84_11835 [Acidobacteriota bacterium]|nr:hypothetical protein [Acidobacteriota bacterium]